MVSNRIPLRPLCDLPNFGALCAADTSVKDAWLEYLKSAARPYSFKSFWNRYAVWRRAYTAEPGSALNPRAEQIDAEEFVASEQYWRKRSVPKSRIIALRTGASLRVHRGSLELSEQLPLHLESSGEPHIVRFNQYEARLGARSAASVSMPKAIILPEHGWRITAEAIKFCLAHKIAVVSVTSRTSQHEKGLISIVAGDPFGDAQLLRAQVRAKPTHVARAIVGQKVETCLELGCLASTEAEAFSAELLKAGNVAQIIGIEARAARAYWTSRQCEVRSSSRRWPPHWARFTTRNSNLGKRMSPRTADHPVNALLNWSYTVVAGRLSVELFARGASLAIGYLHVDKPGPVFARL